MSNWEDLKNMAGPKEREIKEQKVHDIIHKKYYVPEREWKLESCIVERDRLYKLLGLEKTGEDVKYDSSSTGEFEIKQTSDNTYKMSERKNVSKEVTYIFEVDKYKIADIEKYEELKTKIDRFFAEAEKKFAEYKKDNQAVVPAFFDIKERFSIMWKYELRMLIITAITIILLPFWAISRIRYHMNYNKKYAECIPLANAYLEQVKIFEDEIKQVMK